MLTKIKDTLWAFPAFGVALWLGYSVTLQMTGSVNAAIERMVVAVALWVICALIWRAFCAVAQILTRMTRATSARPREPHRETMRTTRLG